MADLLQENTRSPCSSLQVLERSCFTFLLASRLASLCLSNTYRQFQPSSNNNIASTRIICFGTTRSFYAFQLRCECVCHRSRPTFSYRFDRSRSPGVSAHPTFISHQPALEFSSLFFIYLLPSTFFDFVPITTPIGINAMGTKRKRGRSEVLVNSSSRNLRV